MIDNQKWSDTGPLWLEGQCRDDRKVKRQMSHQKPPDKIHQRILSIKLYWNINALTRLSIFYHSPSRWLRQEKIAGDLNHSVVHLCSAVTNGGEIELGIGRFFAIGDLSRLRTGSLIVYRVNSTSDYEPVHSSLIR